MIGEWLSWGLADAGREFVPTLVGMVILAKFPRNGAYLLMLDLSARCRTGRCEGVWEVDQGRDRVCAGGVG